MTSSTLHTKINNIELENRIAYYFAEIYYPKDKTNKNKFKVGKIEMNKKNNTIYINIYGKPRNKRQNSRIKYCNEDKINLGGFRIRWNVNDNSYKYITPLCYIPKYVSLDQCYETAIFDSGDYMLCDYNDTMYIKVTERYEDLKRIVLNKISKMK